MRGELGPFGLNLISYQFYTSVTSLGLILLTPTLVLHPGDFTDFSRGLLLIDIGDRREGKNRRTRTRVWDNFLASIIVTHNSSLYKQKSHMSY